MLSAYHYAALHRKGSKVGWGVKDLQLLSLSLLQFLRGLFSFLSSNVSWSWEPEPRRCGDRLHGFYQSRSRVDSPTPPHSQPNNLRTATILRNHQPLLFCTTCIFHTSQLWPGGWYERLIIFSSDFEDQRKELL